MIPRLIALDIDGTLFDSRGQISERTLAAICECREKGIEVVLATGRDYDALPLADALNAGIRYAVTTNGSAIYELASRKCIWEMSMEPEDVERILRYTRKRDVFPYLFLDGVGYASEDKVEVFECVDWAEHLKRVTRENMHLVPDLETFVKEAPHRVQKGAILFPGKVPREGYHAFPAWEPTKQFLNSISRVHAVDGGCANLEFVHADATKASGLACLTVILGYSMEEVLAIGDSENDLEMLQAAGTGAAMGNAAEAVKQAADRVILSNDEEGVWVELSRILQEVGYQA